MGDISGVLHGVVDAAHLFQVKLVKFDENLHKNEFFESKKLLNELESHVKYLFNPIDNVNKDSQAYEYELKHNNEELKDLIEEFISSFNDSYLPGVCIYELSELYNSRNILFQEKLLNYTLSQFKIAFSNTDYDINNLRELLLIINSNYFNKFILSLENLISFELSIDSDLVKSKDVNRCKIDKFLEIIKILMKLDVEFSKDLIYYSYQIICKNLISQFDHRDIDEIIDSRIPKTLHFDPKIEFRKISNEEMSFHYITASSNFFESEQGFSSPIHTDGLSKFSCFIKELLLECDRLQDYEFKMRVRMIMACVCSYSASFGRLISESKEDLDKLFYIFFNLNMMRNEVTKMVINAKYRPIISSLDFSSSISELALKEILKKINSEINTDLNKMYIIYHDIINRLSKFPTLPPFNRLFNFVIDIIHFNLIRFVYKSLEDGASIDDLLNSCQKIMDLISENRPPLVHRDSELRAKSRLLLKVLDNRNVDILEFTGCFFTEEETLHLGKLVT